MRLYNRKIEIWMFFGFVISMTIYYFWRTHRDEDIMSSGVYVIGTVDELYDAKHGQGIKGWYWLEDKTYRFTYKVSKKLGVTKGTRLFIRVLPGNNWDEIINTDVAVPKCLDNEDSIKQSWKEIPECKP